MPTKDKPLGRTLGWEVLDVTYPYEGPWFNLRQDRILRNGNGEGTYTYIEHPGSVFVVPLTADCRIALIRSYRYTVDAWCWEIPAGTLADRAGVSPEAAAIEELQEELGATCRRLETLGELYLDNGFCNHLAHFFMAFDVQISTRTKLDNFEQIAEVATFPMDDVKQLIQQGDIHDGDSALALLLAINHITNQSRNADDKKDT